ncbi:MAG: phosphoribosylanthranilate isomerase [Tepidisphaeraceae bacterium]
MSRVRVKICGVMRPEDAVAACRLGADAVGIVLHTASARNVPVDRARRTIEAMSPFVTPVGVFVDAPAQEILDIAAMLGLRTVQLNGEQTPAEVEELHGLAVIQAIRVTRGQLAAKLEPWRRAVAANTLPHLIALVMEPGGEPGGTKQPGGTGVANDWDEVIDAQRSKAFDGLPPLIAAGGLKPETVAEVVRRVRPYAVDVSSGVEASLGMKSEEKLRGFIDAVREAEASDRPD